MMKIKSVASNPDRAGRYTVCFEDGPSMRLYRQTVQDFGLYAGLELSADDFKRLKEQAGAMSAKMRAVRIVAASGVSSGDLERRLVRKGEDPKQAKEAVQWMEDLALVDDRRTAEQIVQQCIRKGYGLARAKQALFEKQNPREYWSEVLTDYPDQLQEIVSFLQTRLTDKCDEKTIRRTIDALLRRGHSYSNIRRGLEQMSMDIEDFPEE